jgi:hypothetical protein
MARYEQRLSGTWNAGLRKAIREAASSALPCCADVMRERVNGLAATAALTGLGKSRLMNCADDYAMNRPIRDRRCGCPKCAAHDFEQETCEWQK